MLNLKFSKICKLSSAIISFSLLITLSLTLSADIKVVKTDGVAGKGLTPVQITKKVQESLAKVRPACISVNGGASGVIISPDGFVLTASHVALNPKAKDKPFTIILEDGRTFKAELLGADKSSDMALLKIKQEFVEIPFVEVSDKVPEGPSVCFLYAHPGGYRKTRPAQLRIGRIRCRAKKKEQTRFIMSDISVQPGDSGGPLFDIDGRLIGLCLSAGPIGVNRFSSIENFHKAFNPMKERIIWGDIKDSQLDITARKIDEKTKKRIMAEFQKRVNDKYPRVMDLLYMKAAGGTKADIKFGEMCKNMGIDVPMIFDFGDIDYGIDDPELIAKLGKLPEGSLLPIPVMSKKRLVTFGIPVTKKHLLVKLSEFKKHQKLHLPKQNNQLIYLTQCATDPVWDLALLKLPDRINFKPLKWPEKNIEIKAGTGLICADMRRRLSWGVATDKGRPITKPGSKGPMLDASKVSSYRAPYPSIIRHSLPLYAIHAGTPVYTFDGELVGLHMGRISRTLGLIIDIDDIKKSVAKMVRDAGKKTSK